MNKAELSDAEIIERAEALGMVMPDSEQNLLPTEQENMTDTEAGGVDLTENQDANPDGAVSQVTQQQLTVEVGDSSNAVSQKLAELGLVDDATAFNQYMVDNQYANYVLPGTITIEQGATYEEIAQLLVDKTIQR